MYKYPIEGLNIMFEQLRETIKYDRTVQMKVSDDETLFHVVQPFMGDLDHEEAWVVCTDANGNVNSIAKLYTGTLYMSPVRIAEVFREAIVTNSYAVFFIHNHPNGDPTASMSDHATFTAINRAGEILGIMARSMVVAGNKYRMY